MQSLLVAIWLYLAAIVAGISTGNTLVVSDSAMYDISAKSELTPELASFLSRLESTFQVTYATYNDANVSLFYDDAPRYDNLVLLPTTKKSIKSKDGLNQYKLLQFINEKGNVLVVGGVSSVLPESFRVFLNELGIYPSPKNYKLFDHFHQGTNGVQLDAANIANTKLVQSLDLDYEGSGAQITNNELIFPIIRSSSTGFTASYNAKSADQDTTWTFGEQGFVAVGLQALNNARLVWLGSEQLLTQDKITSWVFQQQGQLKLQFVQHVNDEDHIPNPTLYRIKNQVVYTVGVSEKVDGKWVPYEVKDKEDTLQLSFRMLDPYQRLDLEPLGPVSSQEDSGVLDTYAYFVNFTIPDHHGMFTFELDYKRHGLSYLVDKRVVAVRHLANDEFRRSWDITNSWLYVASAAIVVVAWVLFVVNYVYVTRTDETKKNI